MHEQDGESEPAHHARRPMNAFLIFCKRHRSVVRDKYPNLENRSITKILGEWWANLDKEEKACYTGLAKQYKDAFFSANPDFKWYKLPAPPLRTLSSRPREAPDKPTEPTNACELYPDTELEKTNNNSTKVDFNKKQRDDIYDAKPLSMFTPGKLADEAQMGGLSRLLATKTENQTPNPYYSPTPYRFNAISTPHDRSHIKRNGSNREDSIRELQNALSETTRVFEEDFDENKSRMYGYSMENNQYTNQDMIDQIVDKRYSKDDDYNYQRNYSDDERNAKSGRSCKGKRYQEFMAVGGLLVHKRQKRDYNDKITDDSYNASCSWESANLRSEDSNFTDESKVNSQSETSAEVETNAEHESSEPDNNATKTFKAADFDLDAKIAALPSLSLEKFQQKKRENKRKKKTVNMKPKVLGSSHNTINTTPPPAYDNRRDFENWRETVIGSQKRKPRKISITRLEINSLVSNINVNETYKVSPEFKIATKAPCTVVQNMGVCKPPHDSADLLALATLAEVAANTSKIGEIHVNNMTAKASEYNASMV